MELDKPFWCLTYNDCKTWSLAHKEMPSIATLAARFGWFNIKRQATDATMQKEADKGRKCGTTVKPVVVLIHVRMDGLQAEAKSCSAPSGSLDAHIIREKVAELERLCDAILSRHY